MNPLDGNSLNSEDFDKEMYLEILREDFPLKRYVSRGDTPDSIDIPGPHQDADSVVYRALRFTMKDGNPRFQPILGAAGMGKTHLYWAIKDREKSLKDGEYRAIYVPSPPAPIRVPLHFHACIVDETGESLFEQAIDMLITKMGGLKGATHESYDYNYAVERLLAEYPGISADVVRVLLRYRLDPAHRDLARRWLFGDALIQEEIDELGVRTILEEDDVTMATLKLLADGSNIPLVLFIDEMEGPYNTHGIEGERHFLEVMKRLYNEAKNLVLVASCLTDVWERIYEIADSPTKSRMEPVVNLRNFTREDITAFLEKSMVRYWSEKNIDPPLDIIFPLTSDDIDEAFQESKGVPREAIRYLMPRLDARITGEEAAEVEPQPDYVIKLTASVMVSTITQALTLLGKKNDIEVSLQVAKGKVDAQATAIISLTNGSDTKLICIDVANVKDWNRSGGVAAFYSVKRLKAIIDAGEANLAIIAVPSETSGAKFQDLSKQMGEKLKTLNFDEESAKALVKATTENDVESPLFKMFDNIVDTIFS
jgi:hypothetical protein